MTFEMTQVQYDALIAAMHPVQLIALQCGSPSSQQENANAAWAHLGLEMGFDSKTVRPSTQGKLFFDAEPTGPRKLFEIAHEIKTDWVTPNYGAKTYLEAMFTLKTIDDNYYNDSAASVVLYFLSNATTWKGEVARRIKNELRGILRNQK